MLPPDHQLGRDEDRRVHPYPAATSCTRPPTVQALVFSRRRYPNIRRHVIRAIRSGWPRVIVLNRPGAEERRERLPGDPDAARLRP